MEEIKRYEGCFVCGQSNPQGLAARFYWDGATATTELTLLAEHEGYKGISHGGIIASLLDEVMVKAILATNQFAVTAEMTVRFITPVRTGDRLRFSGRIVEKKGRLYRMSAEAIDSNGNIVARAEGKFVEGRADLAGELRSSIK